MSPLSPLDKTLPPKKAQAVRDTVEQLLDGVLEVGSADIDLPDEFTLKIVRTEESLQVEWTQNPGLSLPGPDGELLSAEVFDDHTRIDWRAYGFSGAFRVFY
jgi:hypothetical protein